MTVWIEALNPNLGIVNLDRICNVRVVYNRVVASTRDSEEDVYLYYGEPEEAEAAYRRIREALARGEQFLSLREQTSGSEELEQLRTENERLKHALREILQEAYSIPDAESIHVLAFKALGEPVVAIYETEAGA